MKSSKIAPAEQRLQTMFTLIGGLCHLNVDAYFNVGIQSCDYLNLF